MQPLHLKYSLVANNRDVWKQWKLTRGKKSGFWYISMVVIDNLEEKTLSESFEL
jgi:hypothetical protein